MQTFFLTDAVIHIGSSLTLNLFWSISQHFTPAGGLTLKRWACAWFDTDLWESVEERKLLLSHPLGRFQDVRASPDLGLPIWGAVPHDMAGKDKTPAEEEQVSWPKCNAGRR